MSWETVILICAGILIVLIIARLTKRAVMGLCALVIAGGLVVVLTTQAASGYKAATATVIATKAVRTANITTALLTVGLGLMGGIALAALVAAGYFALRYKLSTSQNGKPERVQASQKRKALPAPEETPEIIYIENDPAPLEELNWSEWGF